MRQVSSLLAALAAGLLFGIGLAVARMIDPQKIKDFLDIAAIPQETWDPSLALVMGGAVVTSFLFFRLGRAPRRPLFSPEFRNPTTAGINGRLVGGAAIFGVGWGLSGLCPGPGIADLGILPWPALIYIGGMVAGSWGTGILLAGRRSGQDEFADAPAE